jgi:hypothetical protein
MVIMMGKGAAAQDMAGIVTDRYTGINRMFINPASVFDSPWCVEFSLVTANMGFNNNYGYIPRESFTFGELFRPSSGLYTNPEFQTYDGITLVDGNHYARIHGPTVRVRYNRHSFALTYGLRTYSHADRVPAHVVNFVRKGIYYEPQLEMPFYETDRAHIGTLSWAEAGLSYAYIISQDPSHRFTAGATGRFLWGFHSGFAFADEMSYIMYQSRVLEVQDLTASLDYSLPINAETLEFDNEQNRVNGHGASFDLGIWYTQARTRGVQRRQGSTYDNTTAYAWSLGFSLLDLGVINVNRNTRRVDFNNTHIIWPTPDENGITTPDEAFTQVRDRVVGGSYSFTTDESFTAFLPSAASLQFDYNLGNNFFAYFMWVQDLPIAVNRAERPSHVGFIPRYERQWFSLALPLTLYEYSKPRIGASVRLGMLTIGAEQPAGLIGLSDLDGFDFYFSLQWGLRKCDRGRSKYMDCPSPWW